MTDHTYQLMRDGVFHAAWDEEFQQSLMEHPKLKEMHERKLQQNDEMKYAKAVCALDKLIDGDPDLAPVYELIKEEFVKRNSND